MLHHPSCRSLWLALLLPLAACDDDIVDPLRQPEAVPALSRAPAAAAPAPLVTVPVDGGSVVFWPYTGTDASGTMSDPMNLVFPGADARELRAALMGLDGDRTAYGFPASFPFDCTWSDAIGGNQTGWVDGTGWTGSAIQLQCGDYMPMRFHVRLFPYDGGTLGGAHFEVLIPGTDQHQVLTWELAEQLVTVDLLRSGLLDSSAPFAPTAPIFAPSVQTIRTEVYNALPVELRAAIGGPLADITEPLPIPTDTRATIVYLTGAPVPAAGDWLTEYDLPFGQLIPKPLCATGPLDYVWVEGPVHFRLEVSMDADGEYRSFFRASGELAVTPMDVTSSPPSPSGATRTAIVLEEYHAGLGDGAMQVSNMGSRFLKPGDGLPGQRQRETLRVFPNGTAAYDNVENCGG